MHVTVDGNNEVDRLAASDLHLHPLYQNPKTHHTKKLALPARGHRI